jgi:Barstar (barnase inhibitor)
MRVIEIDCSDWQSVKDFLTALRAAIGAPDEHGWSVNAFIDSMIWGGINQTEPPYEIRISGTERGPKEIRDHIDLWLQRLRTHVSGSWTIVARTLKSVCGSLTKRRISKAGP